MTWWLMALTVWGGAVALWDLAHRRIPNAGLAVGLVLLVLRWALLPGPSGAAMLAQGFVGLLSLGLPWRWRLMGGGDVKLGILLAAIDLDAFAWSLGVALLAAVVLGRWRSGHLTLWPRRPAEMPRLAFAPLLLPPFLALLWWGAQLG